MDRLSAWTLFAGVALTGLSVRTEEVAIVKSDRVNVRGQANVKSEVVTQLKKGEAVSVLEEIEVKKHKKGEPAKWAKILLPANTPVWVYAPYIELTNKTVNIRRLNVRAGPSENFSILGRIERGTPVKEIRVVENWMEIEAPTNAYAFVAADLLEKQAPAPTLAATLPTPAPEPTKTVETLKPEPEPAPVVDTAASPAAKQEKPATVPATTPRSEATTPAPQQTAEPAPRRVISREGLVIISRSIQAPTDYAVESIDTHKTINYLHTEDETIKLKNFAGRKVIISGEELIDQRWRNTPIIEVETIRLVP